MNAYSVKITIPDVPPFDRQENWFESFVGNIIEPAVSSDMIGRFLFTRYGAIGQEEEKYALFRFEATDAEAVTKQLNNGLAKHNLTISEQSAFDAAGNIGCGERSRFLGSNSKHGSKEQRGDIAFTFLHAAACLMLDCLVGTDPQGYFSLEEETQSGFSKESSLEQFHHLFCNMTGVPTYLAIGMPPNSTDVVPLSYEEYKRFSQEDGWRLGSLRKAQF